MWDRLSGIEVDGIAVLGPKALQSDVDQLAASGLAQWLVVSKSLSRLSLPESVVWVTGAVDRILVDGSTVRGVAVRGALNSWRTIRAPWVVCFAGSVARIDAMFDQPHRKAVRAAVGACMRENAIDGGERSALSARFRQRADGAESITPEGLDGLLIAASGLLRLQAEGCRGQQVCIDRSTCELRPGHRRWCRAPLDGRIDPRIVSVA